jgi:E3 ubiquitin-protein ligase HUWE1
MLICAHESCYAPAINVMSTFIHNEPTSLPILQEAKLPQSFLSTITEYTTVSTDVSGLSDT